MKSKEVINGAIRKIDPPPAGRRSSGVMRLALLLLSALTSVHARQAVSAQPHAACRLRGGAKDQHTYAMMKPDICSNRKAEVDIKRLIKEAGLTIVREERCRLSKAECEEFYAEHSERPFFPGLVRHRPRLFYGMRLLSSRGVRATTGGVHV